MASDSSAELERIRYPIGRFDPKIELAPGQRPSVLESIAGAPARMRAAIDGLDDRQLDTPYRDGGWTVRQLVHHVPDSHMNAYIRYKWTLTEALPTIKTYDEAAWARLPDSRETPIEASLALLESLHLRWDVLMRSMSDADFARRMNHPEWGPVDLNVVTRMYDWHGRHHAAHITALRGRMNW
jgi:DinB superfamily